MCLLWPVKSMEFRREDIWLHIPLTRLMVVTNLMSCSGASFNTQITKSWYTTSIVRSFHLFSVRELITFVDNWFHCWIALQSPCGFPMPIYKFCEFCICVTGSQEDIADAVYSTACILTPWMKLNPGAGILWLNALTLDIYFWLSQWN